MPFRFFIILSLVLLAEYYSFVVVRAALRALPNPWRIGLFTLYLLGTLAAWAGVIFFRKIDWAHFPHYVRNIYIAFSLGLTVGKVLVLAVMLVDDLRRLVLYVINLFFTGGTKTAAIVEAPAANGISRSVFLSRLALLIGGTALGGFLYGITNRYNYHVKRVKLVLDKLPAGFKGLKIVQISDIHSGSFDNHEAVANGVRKIMAEQPDLILFTGDLVNNRAEEMEPYKALFASLKAPLGVYSTLGNHDYGDYVEWPSEQAKQDNLEKLKAIHAAMGWRLLMNEHVLLSKGSEKIALIGIVNWSAKPQFPMHGDLAKAYTGLEQEPDLVKILLSHDPSHWDAQVVPDFPEIDLMLAGHTHGMQFGIEIPGFKWSPVEYVYKKWAGLYQTGSQYLYVNRGYGFLGYPGRLGILPEITVLELV
ncbi:MAG: metallophosphoesterase [Bacteroidetes bacterium]|nr:metallophosphoesterase [Bacteroidota bacterium]